MSTSGLASATTHEDTCTGKAELEDASTQPETASEGSDAGKKETSDASGSPRRRETERWSDDLVDGPDGEGVAFSEEAGREGGQEILSLLSWAKPLELLQAGETRTQLRPRAAPFQPRGQGPSPSPPPPAQDAAALGGAPLDNGSVVVTICETIRHCFNNGIQELKAVGGENGSVDVSVRLAGPPPWSSWGELCAARMQAMHCLLAAFASLGSQVRCSAPSQDGTSLRLEHREYDSFNLCWNYANRGQCNRRGCTWDHPKTNVFNLHLLMDADGPVYCPMQDPGHSLMEMPGGLFVPHAVHS